MHTRLLSLAVSAALLATGAQAGPVSPTFVADSVVTSGAQGTQLYRADMTGLGLGKIGAVTITDSNSGVGGAPGIFSDFDLDAVFLDVDGDATTTGDQFSASSFLFTAGKTRPGAYAPPSSSGGPTSGSSSATSVDTGFATLDTVDAIFFGTGSLTLGDGGSLTAIFAPEVPPGGSMFLFVGEVSGDPGEAVTGLVRIDEEPPAIPLPAAAWLLLTGAGLLWGVRRTA